MEWWDCALCLHMKIRIKKRFAFEIRVPAALNSHTHKNFDYDCDCNAFIIHNCASSMLSPSSSSSSLLSFVMSRISLNARLSKECSNMDLLHPNIIIDPSTHPSCIISISNKPRR